MMLRRPTCLLVLWLVAVCGVVRAGSAAKAQPAHAFLARYCARCHGAEKPKGDFKLPAAAATASTDEAVAAWTKIYAKIAAGEMPPMKAKQPAAAERQAVLSAFARSLEDAGAVADERRLDPSRGNWLDHDALFSGKAAGTATRGRLWRLTGKAYEEFIQSLNLKYRLRFKTYGHQRVRAPWQLAPQKGFTDYAAGHRIGEPEIEHHLRNATRVARAMLAGLPKSRNADVRALKVAVEAGASSTESQIRKASTAAFAGILGRPPNERELERYSGFLTGNLQTLSGEKAVEQLLIAILFHPELMYRIELPDSATQRAMMPPRDLARSIAYALTDREPDAGLLHAVAAGKLSTREQVRTQVRRILTDKSIAKPRILRFFQEYFGYTRAIDVFKDSATRKAAGFRGKNDWHPNFFVSDADKLIEWVLAADRNVLYELLTTPKTFALTGDTKQASGVKRNATKPFSLFAKTTLDIYEIDITRPQWSDAKPFDMPRRHRMGILTHPGWLISHSTNFDNHAIDRGRWIRERLLGGRIPDIPVTVDAQLPDEPDRTLRERMRVTRTDYCWKCHRQMDPLGLPFEQFDHFGRYRTTELKRPVDVSGSVEGSGDAKLDGPVQDPFELLRKLAASKRVEQVFVRHVFRYFLGRNETLADGPVLIAAHKAYTDNHGSMHALIESLLTSDAFLYRTASTIRVEHQPQGAK